MNENNQESSYSTSDEITHQHSSRQTIPPSGSRIPRFLIDLGNILFNAMIIVVIFFVIQYFLFANVKVEGSSMTPTLENGDRLVLNKVSKIERFDIVVLKAPDVDEKENVQYIKRVIGMPGDTVEMNADSLIINGEPVKEKYLPVDVIESLPYYYTNDFTLNSLLGTDKVPEHSYFVLGDNRLNSKDSRVFGFVDEDDVMGKISLRYWPLAHFEFFK